MEPMKWTSYTPSCWHAAQVRLLHQLICPGDSEQPSLPTPLATFMSYFAICKADMPPGYTVSIYSRLFRWLFRPVFRSLFHILCQIKIEGLENIPASGAYLVAINHVSLYEPPFVLAFWPRPLEAVGAVEIWNRRGQAILVRMYGGIQVHRGQFDRKLIDSALAVVQAGYPLLLSPE